MVDFWSLCLLGVAFWVASSVILCIALRLFDLVETFGGALRELITDLGSHGSTFLIDAAYIVLPWVALIHALPHIPKSALCVLVFLPLAYVIPKSALCVLVFLPLAYVTTLR